MVKQVPDYPMPPRRQGKLKSGSSKKPGSTKLDADMAYEFTEPKMYLDDPPKLDQEKSAGAS
jgi:hypothetical protein